MTIALLVAGGIIGVFGAALVIVGIRRRETLTTLLGIAALALGSVLVEYAVTVAVIDRAVS